MPLPPPPPLEWPPIFDEVRAALGGATGVWVVGGAVRDLLLNRRVHDLDFAVAGDGLALARKVADALNGAYYPLDREQGVGRVLLDRDGERIEVDFASLRAKGLRADLADRDFTVNAMAADVANPTALIDPLGGYADLRAKVLRACSPYAIARDPIRALRAVRLAAQLDFRLEPDTRAQVRDNGHLLPRAAAERQRDEFIKCLAGPRPAGAVRALDALGLLPHLVPELEALKGVTQSPPHVYDVWEHTLLALTRLRDVLTVLSPVYDVDSASDLTLGLVSLRLGRHREALAEHLNRRLTGDRPARWLLMLACLLHDVGKPATQSVDDDGRIRFFDHDKAGAGIVAPRLAALRFSAEETRRASTIVAHHLRPMLLANDLRSGAPITGRAVYRFFRDTSDAGVDVVLLSLGDFLGTYGEGPPPTDAWNRHLDVCVRLLQAYFERPEESVRPPPLVNGDDLQAEFGLRPGPGLGRLLEDLREAQANGEVADRDAALQFVRERLDHHEHEE